MFLYGKIGNLVAEAYNQFQAGYRQTRRATDAGTVPYYRHVRESVDFCGNWAGSRGHPGPAARTGRRTRRPPAQSESPPRRSSMASSTTRRGPETRFPSTGGSRTTRCEARRLPKKRRSGSAYDAEALYFAFRCLDTQPEKIRTTISRRDNAFSDDWVGVSLDSSRAGQLAYHLFVNPSGIQMDALQSGSTGEDFAPDWVWQSAGHVGADGWSAEIRVPLENIRFRSGADVRMGVLFWRRLSRTGVSASWPEMAPRQVGVRVECGRSRSTSCSLDACSR